MRKFLSKVLLVVFIFVFAFPASLLAQNNSWVPPAGPPLQNNTPSPVNIGTQPQTKRGNLTIQGMFEGRGINSFRVNPTPTTPASFSAAFTPFYFLDNVSIGNTTTFPTFDIYGTLKYKPPVLNIPNDPMGGQLGGQLGGQDGEGPTTYTGAPETGYVLTSIDDEGTVSWRPGLPTGGANGDTLVWNETCNCWVIDNGGGGGGTGTGLPPAEAGQTLWFNGETGAWEATDRIKHFVAPQDALVNETRITNDRINLFGTQRVDIGSFGLNNETIINSGRVTISGNNEVNIGNDTGGQTNIKSPTVVFTDDGNNVLTNVSFRSNSVNFGIGATYQEVSFDSNAVKIRGQSDFGQGRIPYSVDEEGTFRWNENLLYTNEQIGNTDFGVLNINNPQNGFGLLRNQGYTNLLDDVVVGQEGQVFLTGLISGYLPEREQGLIKPLCYVETTKRIVNCNTDTITFNDNEIGDVFTPGLADPTFDGSVTYTPDSPQEYHEFDHTGNVEVKYCSGGGGGGGGGIGAGTGENQPSQGGNGGGGGAAGECDEITLAVTPGDRLYWLIGEGGDGGARAELNSSGGSSTTSAATSGEQGGMTQIYFMESGTQGQNQIGETLIGGPGGMFGKSVFQGAMAIAAAHGNTSLSTGVYGWWFNGGYGRLANGSSNNANVVDINPSCNACGGKGGMGEAYSADGSLRTPDNNPITNYQELSSGGGGGIAAGTSSNSYTNLYGVNGRGGDLTFGGGGGGGSYGRLVIIFPTASLRGGKGGVGGDGYVRITGLPNYNGSTSGNEWVWSSPGTYTVTQTQILNGIPSGVSNVTVELWGAGGGAGHITAVTSLTYSKYSGAGGGGGYKKISVPIQELSQYEFNVGSRGLNGGTVTTMDGNGDNGSPTTATDPSGSVFTALGGGGGDPHTSTNSTPDGGNGGSMNPVSTPPNGQTGTAGQDGSTSTNTSSCSSSGAGVGFSGFGSGAPRGCKNSFANGSDIIQGQSSHGRVRISW